LGFQAFLPRLMMVTAVLLALLFFSKAKCHRMARPPNIGEQMQFEGRMGVVSGRYHSVDGSMVLLSLPRFSNCLVVPKMERQFVPLSTGFAQPLKFHH